MSCDSTCSTNSPLLEGGKKKRPLNAWMTLVMRLKKENPSLKLKEVLKMAKKEYSKTKTTSSAPKKTTKKKVTKKKTTKKH